MKTEQIKTESPRALKARLKRLEKENTELEGQLARARASLAAALGALGEIYRELLGADYDVNFDALKLETPYGAMYFNSVEELVAAMQVLIRVKAVEIKISRAIKAQVE